MNLVLLGPPGAGKGTLAALLKDSLNLLHISTGDLLREEIKEGTALGVEAKAFIDKGELVPDEVVIKLIENTLSNKSSSIDGYLLDGFPRTEKQASDLDSILTQIGAPVDKAFYMETELDLIIKRLTGRRVCKNCGAVYHVLNRPPKVEDICDVCGKSELYQRADDNEETIRNRMDVYLKNTKPVISFYEEQNKLINVDGNSESEDLQTKIMNLFHEDDTEHNT